MSINEEIKRIEKEQAKLAKEKDRLAKEAEKQAAREKKLETLVDKSGFESPRALVEAIIKKYGLRITKKLGAAPATASGRTRRKRTKVTPALRDAIKKEVNGGLSMNQASKKHEISYAVIAKIIKGAYDKM